MACDCVEALGETDCAVLTVFHIEDRPLQEEQVHHSLQKHRERLPINSSIPLKVVEQRVDVLHDDQYLESVITTPDPTAQEMLAAYILTENGEQLF